MSPWTAYNARIWHPNVQRQVAAPQGQDVVRPTLWFWVILLTGCYGAAVEQGTAHGQVRCKRVCDNVWCVSTLLCTQQCQIKIDALCIPLFFTNPESNIGWTPQCVSMCFSQQVGRRFGFNRRGRGAWGSWGYQVPCNIILSSWPRKVPIPNVPPLRCQERLPEFDGRHAAWSRFETTFAWNVSSTSQMPWIIRAGQVVTFS